MARKTHYLRVGRRLLLLALAIALPVMEVDPARAQWLEPERWLGGSDAITLGVDTSRFRVSTLGTKPVIATEDQASDGTPYRLIDSGLYGTAVSVDLKLQWPSSSAAGTAGAATVEPYLSFGPTLFAVGFENTARLGQPGPRSEGSLALGLHWGAGLSWRLWKNTELFGGYRFMQSAHEGVLSGGERSETDLSGHDIHYGISIRF